MYLWSDRRCVRLQGTEQMVGMGQPLCGESHMRSLRFSTPRKEIEGLVLETNVILA